jgi:hypothetical protein
VSARAQLHSLVVDTSLDLMNDESEFEITLQSLGDFCCEAAVLVAVFGPLERLLRREILTIAWTAETGASAMILLSAGTLLKIGAARWTNR